MRRIVFSISVLLVAACSLSQPPQVPSVQPEDTPASSLPRDLSNLPLASPRRLEFEDALNRRDFRRAETILVEESNRLDPRSQFTLAMAYIKLGRGDWARRELEKLATTPPTSPLYLYWLARLDYDGQSYTAAIGRLQKVIELDPGMMRAYDLLGLCHDYLGQFDEAIKSYTRAVELNRLQARPSPWPLVDLSISLVAVNRLTEAEKSLREALGYDAHLPQAHYQLGRVLEMQQEDPAAIQSLNQAVALDSTYAEPHYLLGRVYQRLGKDQLARTEIEHFQKLNKTRGVQTSPGSQPPSK